MIKPLAEMPTNEQLRDYFEWHVQNGRGKDTPMLDRRGLQFLRVNDHGNIILAPPQPGETHADGKTFLRAVF